MAAIRLGILGRDHTMAKKYLLRWTIEVTRDIEAEEGTEEFNSAIMKIHEEEYRGILPTYPEVFDYETGENIHDY